MGVSLPEASSELAAVMTLRVTNTKSKVVIVHLEGGRQRGELEAQTQWARGSHGTQHKVINSTRKDLKSHQNRGCVWFEGRLLQESSLHKAFPDFSV